jgi:hypothetical protein
MPSLNVTPFSGISERIVGWRSTCLTDHWSSVYPPGHGPLSAPVYNAELTIAALQRKRVDVLEFIDIARAVGVDPLELFRRVVESR